jgi:hypothetical protein
MAKRKAIVFDEQTHQKLCIIKATKGFQTFNDTMEWMIKQIK